MSDRKHFTLHYHPVFFDWPFGVLVSITSVAFGGLNNHRNADNNPLKSAVHVPKLVWMPSLDVTGVKGCFPILRNCP